MSAVMYIQKKTETNVIRFVGGVFFFVNKERVLGARPPEIAWNNCVYTKFFSLKTCGSVMEMLQQIWKVNLEYSVIPVIVSPSKMTINGL